jgi:mercuric reductase
MAGKSRWKVESTNRALAALEAVKTLLQREQKLAQLSEQEREAWRYLIASYPERGRAAYAEEIQAALNWTDPAAAEQAIARLDQLDLVALQAGLVATVYPYSVSPTLHEVHFPSKPEWQPVYAASAIDALGVSSLVEQEVAVESKCAYCDAPIHVGLKGGDLLEAKPEAMRLWVGNQAAGGGERTAAAICESAVFACSDQHLAAWRGRSGQRDGYLLTLGEAAFVAKGLYAGLFAAS